MKPLLQLALAGATAVAFGVEASAQVAAPAQPTKPLPADSLERARRYAFWMMGGSADSVLAHMSEGMRTQVGGKAWIETQQAQIAERAGAEKAVVEERFAWRHDQRQYWRTMAMSALDEPFLLRIVMAPSGEIIGMGMSPASMAPPADSAGPPIRKP